MKQALIYSLKVWLTTITVVRPRLGAAPGGPSPAIPMMADTIGGLLNVEESPRPAAAETAQTTEPPRLDHENGPIVNERRLRGRNPSSPTTKLPPPSPGEQPQGALGLIIHRRHGYLRFVRISCNHDDVGMIGATHRRGLDVSKSISNVACRHGDLHR